MSTKHLRPEKFTGPRGAIPFRQWTQDFKDLCSRYSQELLRAMEEVEHYPDRVTTEQME